MTSSNGPSAAARVRSGSAGPPAEPLVGDRNELPDRIWTVPNALSVLRLLGVPLFLWLLLGPQADGWAVVVLMVAGLSDWADGKLARVLGQSSRLGALLDPAADRLYIVATLIAFVLRDVVPFWVVAVLVGRELVLGAMLLVLARYGYPPLQVHYLGKAATFNLLYAFPLLLLADGEGPVVAVVQPVAYAFTIWGGSLYVLAGVLYVVQVLGLVRAERAGVPAAGAAP
ncbi:CDP-alcohol phosphatidyltransferase family protein [Geodermatophilus sp. CPCC 206100]|uniref:CDP-alcohol phosphatidyltransferase family protein n=1 Tax=Geodermatophilus sp. CPCC 206100 TaxID=3020054 RepID=UPI003B00C9C8